MVSILFSFIFPRTLPLTFDGWYVLWLKQWSWAHCHWKLDSHTHPFACCLFSISLFPSVLLLSCWSLSVRTGGHAANIPFRAASNCWAAKLTLCCHESDSEPDSGCHLHRCLTSQSVLKRSLKHQYYFEPSVCLQSVMTSSRFLFKTLHLLCWHWFKFSFSFFSNLNLWQ